MLKGIVLTDKQVSKWGDMLSPLDTSELSYTKETYKTDCENRAKLTCDTFEYTNTGFNATITASRDVPVFFSIPYEDGWSAYVNGEKVDIEKVNVGFMAIRVNAGTNVKIEFKYRTPGLFLGMAITVVCVLLFVLYMVLMRTIFKEVPVPLIGFKSDYVYYDRAERFAGESKYPLKKMISFALDGITSFSVKPLKLISNLGILISVLSIFGLLYALISHLCGVTVAGWTAIVASIWLLGGLQMLCLGVVGGYIGKIYSEVKQRPRFLIETHLKAEPEEKVLDEH